MRLIKWLIFKYMMRLSFLILLVFSLSAQALPVQVNAGRPRQAAAASITYDINQNFEGSGGGATDDGYDNSEVWFEANNPDEDYTTSPAPLKGSQSIYFRDVTTGVRAFSPVFTARGDCWMYIEYRPTVIAVGDTIALYRNNSGNVTLVQIDVDATGHLRCDDGTLTSSYTTDAATTGTTWYIWLHYVKGTGANAQYSIGFSSDGTRTTAGNKFTSMANGVSTLDADQIRLSSESGSCAWIGDRCLSSASIIPDNP